MGGKVMEKETAIQKVIEYIKNNIGMGVWPVGTKIPSENNICKLLNVSRTSVRSGMEPFVVLSIISCHQGKGKFIISTDLSLLGKSEESHLIKNPEDVRQSLEVRKIIEPSICKMIAPIISNETLNELKKVLSDMVTSVGNS
jgi:GntR family transcriptional repressor for pyruvate dehydrogenase complex